MTVTFVGPSGREYTMHGPRGDHQVRHWRSGHFYEGDEGGLLEWAWGNPEYFGRVVDVGASLGNHSVFFAGELGAEVFAIEPHTTDIVTRNVEANGLTNKVSVRRRLIGHPVQHKILYGPENNVGMASFVPGGSLRNDWSGAYLYDVIGDFRPSAIKIDAEGMSIDALTASMSIVLRLQPIVMMEVSDDLDLLMADTLLLDHTRLPQTFNSTPTHVWIPS